MFKIAKKDLKLFFTDKKAVMLTFILPIALITLFAFAYGGMGASSKRSAVKLLITDEDNSALSQELTVKLDSNATLKIEKIALTEAKALVKKGDRVAVLVFHKGLRDSIEQGKPMPIELFYDQAREIEYGMLQQSLYSTLFQSIGQKAAKQRAVANIKDSYGYMDSTSLASIIENVESQFEGGDGAEMSSNLKSTPIIVEDKNKNFGLIQAVAGTAVMMLLFSVAGMGSSMLSEKEDGTLKRLLYAPIKASDILFGKMISTTFVAILQLLIMFIFAWLVFGLDIFINLPAILIMIFATALACAGFGMFLAAIGKTRKQVESFSTLIILVMSAIGGSMMPLAIMPAFMQELAKISLNYWSIQGFYDIFWRQLPMADILLKAGVLLLIAVVVTAISYSRFKKNILDLA